MGISESRPASTPSSPAVIKNDSTTAAGRTMPTSSPSTSNSTSVRRRPAIGSSSSSSSHSAASSTSSKQRSRGSHMFFYDASKSSVAIFTDANTLTKKFQTRKIDPSSSRTHDNATSTVVSSRAVPPVLPQRPWSMYDNAPPSDDDGDYDGDDQDIVGHPAPPPYEVTLGRTSYGDGSCCPIVANDENCNYTKNVLDIKCEDKMTAGLPRGAELRQMIAKYNSTAAKGYEMELREESSCVTTFHGFIRVSMNLSRPINVFAGCRPPSIYDIIDGQDTADHGCRTLTSFYLPRDTVKALHVTSETSTQELVATLLRKFKVADNPRQYCLYEKYCEGDGSVKGVLRRLQNCERPLWLVLSWSFEDVSSRRLVLQENDTGDILWEAFTVPELSNFLRILDREEEEYLNLVRVKYKKLESLLRRAMDRFEPYVETSSILDDDCGQVCGVDDRTEEDDVIL